MSKSKYKFVYSQNSRLGGFRKYLWYAQISTPTFYYKRYTETEREAAIAADKYLIRIGREPVNILKRKTNDNPNT